MIYDKSQIIVTEDFEKFKEEIEEDVGIHSLRVYFRDEFKVEDAKEVIKEAYIASKDPKILLLGAPRYNIYAQNALLKILEEPPPHILFLLLTRNKTTFLPTILSRLPVKKIKSRMEKVVDMSDFDLEKLYNLVQKSKDLSKAEAKEVLKSMLGYAVKMEFDLDERELSYFDKALQLIELNSNKANLFITTGLILLTHKKKRK